MESEPRQEARQRMRDMIIKIKEEIWRIMKEVRPWRKLCNTWEEMEKEPKWKMTHRDMEEERRLRNLKMYYLENILS